MCCTCTPEWDYACAYGMKPRLLYLSVGDVAIHSLTDALNESAFPWYEIIRS